MDLDLNGKTAVVTGASRGIGLAVARALSAEGVRVVAGARTPGPELEAAAELVVPVDLAVAGGPERLVERALEQLGGIDLLVNNVGGNPAPVSGFLTVEDAHWDHVLELNLMSAVRACRAALPSLLQRRGAIVNVASANARMAQPAVVAYAAAKAALLNLGKALAEEFGPQGVRVNTISPGPVLTGMWTDEHSAGAAIARSIGLDEQAMVEQLPSMVGMTSGRFADPDEVAALVLLLASGKAPSVSGADLVIDGGALKTV
jgi:NAD(P)-dependent dehydrogenase (short-subunit alcohol dehydrogenase family)